MPAETTPARINWGVRAALIVLPLGLIAGLCAAAYVRPYDEAGRPLTMGSHTQLGLEPCGFKAATGKPCASCGMTTSFALLAHGDPVNSLRANWVGTLLCMFCVALIPWCAACLARGRLIGARSLERPLLVAGAAFAILALARWGVILALEGAGV